MNAITKQFLCLWRYFQNLNKGEGNISLLAVKRNWAEKEKNYYNIWQSVPKKLLFWKADCIRLCLCIRVKLPISVCMYEAFKTAPGVIFWIKIKAKYPEIVPPPHWIPYFHEQIPIYIASTQNKISRMDITHLRCHCLLLIQDGTSLLKRKKKKPKKQDSQCWFYEKKKKSFGNSACFTVLSWSESKSPFATFPLLTFTWIKMLILILPFGKSQQAAALPNKTV